MVSFALLTGIFVQLNPFNGFEDRFNGFGGGPVIIGAVGPFIPGAKRLKKIKKFSYVEADQASQGGLKKLTKLTLVLRGGPFKPPGGANNASLVSNY